VSSNGSGAILAASGASLVACASLLNEPAAAALMMDSGIDRWWLVPAGARGQRRIEDDYVCARLARSLAGRGAQLGSAAQRLCRACDGLTIADIAGAPGARWVIEHVGPQDVEFILNGDYSSTLVPVLREGLIVSAAS
jgi:phosphosulfolactate phosphohydrolase-like enzyme